MIGLAYKDGVTVNTLSERYAIPRSTVYYWLDRFVELSLNEAIEDDDRPGRPPALSADERQQLQAELTQSPNACGFNAES
jgi:transposase